MYIAHLHPEQYYSVYFSHTDPIVIWSHLSFAELRRYQTVPLHTSFMYTVLIFIDSEVADSLYSFPHCALLLLIRLPHLFLHLLFNLFYLLFAITICTVMESQLFVQHLKDVAQQGLLTVFLPLSHSNNAFPSKLPHYNSLLPFCHFWHATAFHL